MSITEEEKTRCAEIINRHAALAVLPFRLKVLTPLPVPVVVVAATKMAMALSSVFGLSITESEAWSLATEALKKKLMEQSKAQPFPGQFAKPADSAFIIESAGWLMADELYSRRPPVCTEQLTGAVKDL